MSDWLISEFFVWGVLWQGTLCLALGLFVSFLLYRHAARAQQVLRLGMLAAILVPVLSVLVQQWNLGLLPPLVDSIPEVVAEPLLAMEFVMNEIVTDYDPEEASVIPPEASDADLAPVPVSNSKTRDIPWMLIALLFWPVVGLVLFFRLVRTFVLGMRLLRAAVPCERPDLIRAARRACSKLSVQAHVTIKESRSVGSPVIWCWGRRPVLLVQRDIERTPGTDWVGVFCHELAHWKRRDHLTGLWAELWLCVFWWHPLVWWAKQRLEILSEQACDDWVLASGQSGPDYAESLLELTPEARMAFLPTVVGKDKTMKERIIRIVKNESGNPRVGWSWAMIVVLLTSLLIVGSAFAQRRVERAEREGWTERRGAFIDEREHEDERHEELDETIERVEREIGKKAEELHDLEEEGHGDSEGARRLREVIQHLERRIHELHREKHALTRRHREHELAEHREMHRKRQQIVREVQEMERYLQRHRVQLERLERAERGDSDEAHALREKLEEAHPKLERLHHALREIEEHAHHEHKHEHEEEEIEHHRHELEAHKRELMQRGRQLKAKLKNLQKRNHHPEETEVIQKELEHLHQQLQHATKKHTIRSVHNLSRPRPEPRPHTQQGHRKALELEHKAEGVRRALEAIGDSNPDLTERLERELHEIRMHMEAIEREARNEERPGRSHPDLEAKVHELNGKVERLGHEMREIRGLLERLIDRQRPQWRDVEEEEERRRGRTTRRRTTRSRRDDEEGDAFDVEVEVEVDRDDDDHDHDHDDDHDHRDPR